jgi:hypothetical protein
VVVVVDLLGVLGCVDVVLLKQDVYSSYLCLVGKSHVCETLLVGIPSRFK